MIGMIIYYDKEKTCLPLRSIVSFRRRSICCFIMLRFVPDNEIDCMGLLFRVTNN